MALCVRCCAMAISVSSFLPAHANNFASGHPRFGSCARRSPEHTGCWQVHQRHDDGASARSIRNRYKRGLRKLFRHHDVATIQNDNTSAKGAKPCLDSTNHHFVASTTQGCEAARRIATNCSTVATSWMSVLSCVSARETCANLPSKEYLDLIHGWSRFGPHKILLSNLTLDAHVRPSIRVLWGP